MDRRRIFVVDFIVVFEIGIGYNLMNKVSKQVSHSPSLLIALD